MIVVRYGTLVALVLWLGAMLGARFGDLLRACAASLALRRAARSSSSACSR